MAPNKRLKLTGPTLRGIVRVFTNELTVRDRAALRPRAFAPQLKRNPLGRHSQRAPIEHSMPLSPSVLLLLAIGDPMLIVGILALIGVLHLPTPVPLVLTTSGVFLNVAAVVAIARRGPRPNG